MAIAPSIMIAIANFEIFPDLEAICSACRGGRCLYDSDSDSYPDCKSCNGSGYVPTPVGARILDLVRHNARVTVSSFLKISPGH